MRKTAIITGAGRGIGRAIAHKLAYTGHNLVLVGRNLDNLKATAKQCTTYCSSARIILATIQEPLSEIITRTIQEFKAIDILINNAGRFIERPIWELTETELNETFDTNFKLAFELTKHCLPYLKESSSAAIINIASIASKHSYAGGTLYSASKHAMLGFSNSLFHDVREMGIKVCAILPGYINTDMHEGNTGLDGSKMIQPSDIADTVHFILNFPTTACPVEIHILPQYSPRKVN